MPTVLMIRHGESQSNAGLPTICPENVALTDLGVEQAECIAYYLAYEVLPDLIVTSSYQRTKQTAVPTKLRFPSVPAEEWPVYEFTYLSEEEFRGPSSVEDRKPLKEMYWEICDPELVERVRSVIKTIKETSYDTIAIFSHEQFMRALLWVTEGKLVTPDADAMRAFKADLMSDPLPNGAILRSDFHNSQECWEWKLIDTHPMAFV